MCIRTYKCHSRPSGQQEGGLLVLLPCLLIQGRVHACGRMRACATGDRSDRRQTDELKDKGRTRDKRNASAARPLLAFYDSPCTVSLFAFTFPFN